MRKAANTLVKLAISALLVWLFLRQTSWEDLSASILSTGLSPWLVGTGFFLSSNLLGAFQWRVLLRVQSIELTVRQAVILYFIGVFFNNFLVSNIGGDAVRVYDLKRLTGRATPGFAATFLDRFIGLSVLILFSVCALALEPDLWSAGVAGPVLALVCALLGVLAFGFSRRLSAFVLRQGSGRIPDRAVAALEGIREAFLLYRRQYRALVRVGLLAGGVQLSRIAVYYAIGLGVGVEAGFQHFVVFIPLIAIVAAVPISFGGIGVRENLGAVLFATVGVPEADALATMFLGYLAGIAASLAGGIAFAARRTRRTDSISEGQEA